MKNIGQFRRNVVLVVLGALLLVGAVAWAKPRLDAWLLPPPPPPECTSRSIAVSGIPKVGDMVAARKWVGIENEDILGYSFIWNTEMDRLEYWLLGEEYIWQLEFKCFAIVTPGTQYAAAFGEFKKVSVEEAVAQDKNWKELEN